MKKQDRKAAKEHDVNVDLTANANDQAIARLRTMETLIKNAIASYSAGDAAGAAPHITGLETCVKRIQETK
jgi:hypothetical protein